jgi:hypothetical protein
MTIMTLLVNGSGLQLRTACLLSLLLGPYAFMTTTTTTNNNTPLPPSLHQGSSSSWRTSSRIRNNAGLVPPPPSIFPLALLLLNQRESSLSSSSLSSSSTSRTRTVSLLASHWEEDHDSNVQQQQQQQAKSQSKSHCNSVVVGDDGSATILTARAALLQGLQDDDLRTSTMTTTTATTLSFQQHDSNTTRNLGWLIVLVGMMASQFLLGRSPTTTSEGASTLLGKGHSPHTSQSIFQWAVSATLLRTNFQNNNNKNNNNSDIASRRMSKRSLSSSSPPWMTTLFSWKTLSAVLLLFQVTQGLIKNNVVLPWIVPPILTALSRFSSWYMTTLTARPLLTKCVTASFIAVVGDRFAQWLEAFIHHRSSSSSASSSSTTTTTNTMMMMMMSRGEQLQPSSTSTTAPTTTATIPMENLSTQENALSSSTSSSLPSPPRPPVVVRMKHTYDVRRGLSTMADALFLTGPLLHFAYNFLEHLLPVATATSGMAANGMALGQVLIDDFIVDAGFVAIMFWTTGISEGYTLREIYVQLQQDLFPTIQATWASSIVLIPIEFVIFRFLPLGFRVLGMNVVDIFWGAMVSYMAHRNRPKKLVMVVEDDKQKEDAEETASTITTTTTAAAAAASPVHLSSSSPSERDSPPAGQQHHLAVVKV